MVRSISRTSLALSVFLIWPSVQSLHSMRKVVSGFTEATGGMSGCQRLCPSTCCWLQGLERSTLNRVSWLTAIVVMIYFPSLVLDDDSEYQECVENGDTV